MTSREMTGAALRAALVRLGAELREPASLILGGSAALLLTGVLNRVTSDGDVVESLPEFGKLQDVIRRVETSEQAPPGWLNTSVQSYTHVLPRDYRSRLVPLPQMGKLHVTLLGRADVVLMKVYAGRPRDLTDLRAVEVTEAELSHVETSLPEVARHEPDKAKRMQAILSDLRKQLRKRPADR